MIPFKVNIESGGLVFDTEITIAPWQSRSAVRQDLAGIVSRANDFGNGFAWDYYKGLGFYGCPIHIGLCFQDNALFSASWNVSLADVVLVGGRPDAQSNCNEIAFVRAMLLADLSIDVSDAGLKFNWGVIWSGLDPKTQEATHGLRYTA